MNRRTFLFGAVGVAVMQSAAVGAMIFNRAQRIANGREVVIESALVDPRDLFRGHFVTLNLTVGTLEQDKIEVDSEFKYNSEVYVELEKGDGVFWIAKKLWHAIPPGSTSAFIKGEVTSVPNTNRKRYRIRFPFDRYFAPRKRAKELEKFRQDQNLGVVLSLDEAGIGYIKGISIQGETIYDEPIF